MNNNLNIKNQSFKVFKDAHSNNFGYFFSNYHHDNILFKESDEDFAISDDIYKNTDKNKFKNLFYKNLLDEYYRLEFP